MKLTAAHLDRRQREREIAGMPLPALLLRTGAMEAPPARQPLTLRNERVFGAALACIAVLALLVF